MAEVSFSVSFPLGGEWGGFFLFVISFFVDNLLTTRCCAEEVKLGHGKSFHPSYRALSHARYFIRNRA